MKNYRSNQARLVGCRIINNSIKKTFLFFSGSHGQNDSEKKAAPAFVEQLRRWTLSATAWFYGDGVGVPSGLFSTEREVRATLLRLLTLHIILLGLILACAALA